MTNTELATLKKALLIVGLEEVNKYKDLPDEEISFSEEFEKSIKEINQKRKSIIYKATKTVPRRIALVFVAAIVTFCLMMTISAIRIPVVNFFVNIYEEFIGLFFEEEDNAYVPKSIEKVYQPSYMIDGYVKVDFQQFEDIAETYWESETGLIMLYQEIIEEEYKINFDNEHVGYNNFSIESLTIYYSLSNGEYVCIWIDKGYLYTFILPESTPMTEIEKIISSME